MSQTTTAVIHRHLLACRLNEDWQKQALLADERLALRLVAQVDDLVLLFRREDEELLLARLQSLGLAAAPEGRWRT